MLVFKTNLPCGIFIFSQLIHTWISISGLLSGLHREVLAIFAHMMQKTLKKLLLLKTIRSAMSQECLMYNAIRSIEIKISFLCLLKVSLLRISDPADLPSTALSSGNFFFKNLNNNYDCGEFHDIYMLCRKKYLRANTNNNFI